MLDVVLTQEETDASGHAVHDLPAAFDRHAVIGREIIKPQAELIRAMNVGKDFRVFEERLGWDTTPVETNTAEGVALDDAGFQSQLGSPDGRDVTAGPTANYCYIVLGVGYHSTSQRARSRTGTALNYLTARCTFGEKPPAVIRRVRLQHYSVRNRVRQVEARVHSHPL